jgi:hypothetical protein
VLFCLGAAAAAIRLQRMTRHISSAAIEVAVPVR